MKHKVYKTLQDLHLVLTKNSVPWLWTRNINPHIALEDLDILVRPKDYKKAIKLLESSGYKQESHDEALGGRLLGYQVNLSKKERTKVDLHKDFTWRKTKYLDTSIIWKDSRKIKINKIYVSIPNLKVNALLIWINILFEKTYITSDDREIIKSKKVLKETTTLSQANKYRWEKSINLLINWLDSSEEFSSPQFLPTYIILFSYFEKFRHEKKIDIISLTYYLFFRTLYLLTKR